MNNFIPVIFSLHSSTCTMGLFLVSAFLIWYFSSSLYRIMDVIIRCFHKKCIEEEWSTVAEVVRMKNKSFKEDYMMQKDVSSVLTSNEKLRSYCSSVIKNETFKNQIFCGSIHPDRTSSQPVLNYADQLDQVDMMDLSVLPVDKDVSSKFLRDFLFWPFKLIILSFVFPKHNFPYIYNSVLKDNKMIDVIKEVAEEIASDINCKDAKNLIRILSEQTERATKLLKELRSTLSDLILRLTGWIIFQSISLMYNSVFTKKSEIAMLRKASSTGLPILFLPTHRSHVDYIVITLVLAGNGLRTPLIAAGDNLNIPFFGWFMRGQGAFFIKRRMDQENGKRDKLYRAVLRTYMLHCMEAGHHFEFFLEGRRTRSGKPSMPKSGLLSVFVDAYLNGFIQDALLVPLSINYDKLVDSFLDELSGAPKKPESFLSTIFGLWSALTTKHGEIRINVTQVISLKELVKSLQKNNFGTMRKDYIGETMNSIYDSNEDQRQLVYSIGRHVLFESISATPVMCTNAVCLILLYAFRDGTTLTELSTTLEVLRSDLVSKGKSVGFANDRVNISHAISLLGPDLVKQERRTTNEVFLKPIIQLPNVLELSYYSNVLLPHFALEAIISLSMFSLSKDSVSEVEVLKTSMSLCEILQFEFLLTRPTEDVSDALSETLLNMQQSREVDLSHVNLASKKMHMYAKLLAPLIDAYCVTSESLIVLMKKPWTEKEFIGLCLAEVRCRINNNLLTYSESASTDIIVNCIQLFKKLNIVDIYNEMGIKMVTMKVHSESFQDHAKLIEDQLEQIRKFQTA